MYLKTHCKIGSKRAFLTDVLDTTDYLFTDAMSHICHAHIILFTFASWVSMTSTVTVNNAENLGRYLSGAQPTAQENDFQLFLTVKMELDIP